MKADKKQTYEFLKRHHLGVLSTVASDSWPWGSAIYYVVDEKLNIFFVTRKETYKYQNLQKSPYAALTVTDEEKQITVQLAGEISKVPVEDYMDIIFNKLGSIHPNNDINWSPPIEKVHKGDYIPLRITPSKLQYADFKKPTTDPDHEYIEKIL